MNDSFSSLPHALTESSEAVHSDNIKSDEDVALDLQSIESKSAKACLLELYEDLLLDEHRVCCLLFHRYRQGRAETFGGAGAQSIKGAHGTRLLIGLCFLLICVSKWMLLY